MSSTPISNSATSINPDFNLKSYPLGADTLPGTALVDVAGNAYIPGQIVSTYFTDVPAQSTTSSGSAVGNPNLEWPIGVEPLVSDNVSFPFSNASGYGFVNIEIGLKQSGNAGGSVTVEVHPTGTKSYGDPVHGAQTWFAQDIISEGIIRAQIPVNPLLPFFRVTAQGASIGDIIFVKTRLTNLILPGAENSFDIHQMAKYFQTFMQPGYTWAVATNIDGVASNQNAIVSTDVAQNFLPATGIRGFDCQADPTNTGIIAVGGQFVSRSPKKGRQLSPGQTYGFEINHGSKVYVIGNAGDKIIHNVFT